MALPVLFVGIFVLWIRNKFASPQSAAATGHHHRSNVLVFAENRWLCDALQRAGFGECEQFDVRTLHECAELLQRTDDLDVLARIAAATHVVLGESNLRLIATAEHGDDDAAAERVAWGDELARTVAALAARFRIDSSRVILVPGVPPRDLIGAVDLAPVRALLEQRARPVLQVAPSWCAFERIVRERNDTTYAYMPDNLNANHHGSYALAAMVHALVRPDVAWNAQQKLPDGMTTEMALFYDDVVRDCLRDRDTTRETTKDEYSTSIRREEIEERPEIL